jgi:IclR family transcriptional regulator, KDG regulon repressor
VRATIERALTILQAIAGKSGVNPKQFAEAANLPLSTVYRYLTLFVEWGFAIKNGDRYTAGVKLSMLAHAPNSYSEFSSLVRNLLEGLQGESGETVFLCARSGAQSIALQVIESKERLKLTMSMGDSLPLYASAPSKVLLAFSPADFRQRFLQTVELKPLASGTIVDRRRLERELDAVRKRGYALSTSEVDELASTVSFPILAADGDAHLALAVSGLSVRFEQKRLSQLIAATRRCAEFVGYKYRDYMQAFAPISGPIIKSA